MGTAIPPHRIRKKAAPCGSAPKHAPTAVGPIRVMHNRRSARPLFGILTLVAMLVVSSLGARTSPLSSQDGAVEDRSALPPHLIRVDSNLVMVPVSVTDSHGKLVKNLETGDFAVEENGVPETVVRIADPGETPLELALLFDISGSLNRQFQFELDAAQRFLTRTMRSQDAVSIVSVGQEPQVIMPRTENLDSALSALASLMPTRGATAFYDAVILAARSMRLSARRDARRVEVVLSDGEDNNSLTSQLSDAVNEVLRSDCVFYSINPAGASIRLNKVTMEGQKGLETLASQTGGIAFIHQNTESLEGIFDQINAELQAQYLLEYYSSYSRKDGAFRRIVVRVPGRADLRIRARQGYYAPTS